jgi:hypothetical protein
MEMKLILEDLQECVKMLEDSAALRQSTAVNGIEPTSSYSKR